MAAVSAKYDYMEQMLEKFDGVQTDEDKKVTEWFKSTGMLRENGDSSDYSVIGYAQVSEKFKALKLRRRDMSEMESIWQHIFYAVYCKTAEQEKSAIRDLARAVDTEAMQVSTKDDWLYTISRMSSIAFAVLSVPIVAITALLGSFSACGAEDGGSVLAIVVLYIFGLRGAEAIAKEVNDDNRIADAAGLQAKRVWMAMLPEALKSGITRQAQETVE